MSRRLTLPVAGLFVAYLGLVAGCANPHGDASAVSAVVPVSTSAASGSPSPGSPASGTGVASSGAASSPSASTIARDSTQIRGAVTADSQRQLVLTYLGGDCDVSARGEAIERGSTITVRVLVKSSGGICSAVGYVRTVVAQLSAPLGHRVVQDTTGATVPIVDGALLLHPSWLPDGYTGGTLTAGASTDGKAAARQEWTPRDTTQTASPGVVTCRPTAAGIALTQGYGIAPSSPLLSGEYALTDGTSVDVERDDQGNFGLFWPPPRHPKGWTVSLASEPECSGFTPLSLDVLLKIASGLH